MFTKEELNGILILINRVKDISGSEAEVVVHLKNRVAGTIEALIKQEETKPQKPVEEKAEQVAKGRVVTNKK